MERQQTEVVILGAGYAGMLATVRLAGRLRRARRHDVHLTLVNPSDVFVERLRLHEFAANRPIKVRPISRILRGTGVTFVQGRATGLDIAKREVVISKEAGSEPVSIRYDRLIYAIGSRTDLDSVPGVRQYAFTLSPDGARSAIELREQLAALNGSGRWLVVCGGGATGIEAAAEFASAYPGLKVTLVTRGGFGDLWATEIPEAQAYMRESLDKLGVAVHDGTTVTEVQANAVLMDTGSLPCDLCLWAGGFVAPPLAREAGLAVNERGQILVDPFVRSISHPEVSAIGDAADPVEDPGAKVRMSAFTALIMGAYGADSLSADLLGKEIKPFNFAYLGQGIALGRKNAIGFGSSADDIPHAPFFKGRSGYIIRGSLLRYFGILFDIERVFPGAFWWVGKERSQGKAQKRPRGPRQIDTQSRVAHNR